MSIAANISALQASISPASLLVVTKNRSSAEITTVIHSGASMIAESRLQEIEQKFDQHLLKLLSTHQVSLHFIGHLQTKKIPKIVRYCQLIQSVSSLKQAQKINQESKKIGKSMEIFIQLNLTQEPQKTGILPSKLAEIVQGIQRLPNIQLTGLMCMGKKNDPQLTKQVFQTCSQLADQFHLSKVSMGMSQDYQLALAAGANIIRIGSKIFQD